MQQNLKRSKNFLSGLTFRMLNESGSPPSPLHPCLQVLKNKWFDFSLEGSVLAAPGKHAAGRPGAPRSRARVRSGVRDPAACYMDISPAGTGTCPGPGASPWPAELRLAYGNWLFPRCHLPDPLPLSALSCLPRLGLSRAPASVMLNRGTVPFWNCSWQIPWSCKW